LGEKSAFFKYALIGFDTTAMGIRPQFRRIALHFPASFVFAKKVKKGLKFTVQTAEGVPGAV